MGVYSPPGFVDATLEERIRHTIIEPAVAALARAGAPYRGVLYPGLMITPDGPRVVEFNCRFGDPETQVLMLRLEGDLLEIMLSCVRGTLGEQEIHWSPEPAVGVVVASGGYPGWYQTGYAIEGLDALDEDVQVFHAGTALVDGAAVTAGGRVLTVAARGRTLAEARERVYANVERLYFPGIHYRRDIALRELTPAPSRR
jgi:phosphoribosylamine---glycine ligase